MLHHMKGAFASRRWIGSGTIVAMNEESIPFDPHEDALLISAAKWMRFFAIFLIIVGAIPVLLCTFALILIVGCGGTWSGSDPRVAFLGGCIATALGLALVWQGLSLSSVSEQLKWSVTNYAENVAHLSEAFRSLRRFFVLEVFFGALASATTLWELL